MGLKLVEEYFPEFLRTYITYDVTIRRHNALRLVALYVYGGVYVDHDFIAVKNIEPALGTCEFVLGNEEENEFRPQNSVMAIVAKSPFMDTLIDIMNYDKTVDEKQIKATGTFYLQMGLHKFLGGGEHISLKIYSKKFFYPTHWTNKNKLSPDEISNVFPQCFLYQLFDGSWL